MRLSREKMVHLSHVVVDALDKHQDVTLKQSRNDVRLAIFEVLKEELKREDEIDEAVRRKIVTQKRDIPEGSREWDILFRKYYDDEASKYRKVR